PAFGHLLPAGEGVAAGSVMSLNEAKYRFGAWNAPYESLALPERITPMPALHIAHGQQSPKQVTLEKDKLVLGRHPDCDIVLELGAVSREHAQITSADNQWYVEDLRSRNGTFVNGKQITGRQALVDQDQVRICDFLLTFQKDVPGARTLASEMPDSAII